MRQKCSFCEIIPGGVKEQRDSVQFVTKETPVCFVNLKSNQHLHSPNDICTLLNRLAMRIQ